MYVCIYGFMDYLYAQLVNRQFLIIMTSPHCRIVPRYPYHYVSGHFDPVR